MNSQAIEVSDLVKTYKGNLEAVKGISFCVPRGGFYAFLGPNGAGKSTTIKMLTTLLNPTSGKAVIGGFDLRTHPEKIRMKIGVAMQTNAIDPQLTGKEMLQLQGRLFGLSKQDSKKRADELLELVKLKEDANRSCGKYSGGMQRRLDLAMTLVHKPEILFLDEPTTGLDPASRIDIWQEIKKLNSDYGTTIFLTTQYLEEADQTADMVGIIQDGRIVASGTPEQLKHSLAMDRICLSFAKKDVQEQAKLLLKEFLSNETPEDDGQLIVYTDDRQAFLPAVIQKLATSNLFPSNVEVHSPTLDDVFLHVTQQTQRSDTHGS